MNTSTRTAHNIAEKFGTAGLQRLLAMFEQGHSGPTIGSEFGVTRERVRQWRNTLGTKSHAYVVHQEVETLLETRRTGLA